MDDQVQAPATAGEATAASRSGTTVVFHSGWLPCFVLSAHIKKRTTEAVMCDEQDKNRNEWTCKLPVIPRGRAPASGAFPYYPSQEH